VKITYDPAKRAATLRDRDIDFESAAEVFDGVVVDIPDERFDYGEARVMTVGHLRGRMVIVVWTARGGARHVISMRKANDREQARFANGFRET
jgi:uncharacterized DUF497 family protein